MNKKQQVEVNEALIEAAKTGDTKLALQMLAQGAMLEASGSYGKTALLWAAHFGRTDTALALIDKGADLEVKDNWGRTALIYASYFGHTDTALALISKGANLEAKDNRGWRGWTALTCASGEGNTATALALIAHGADSTNVSKAKDFYGFTPLQACAAGGMISRLKLLLDESAVNTLDSDQPRALVDIALKHDQGDAAAFLQSHLAMKSIDTVLAAAKYKEKEMSLIKQ